MTSDELVVSIYVGDVEHGIARFTLPVVERATYTTLPTAALLALGVRPIETREFVNPASEIILRDVGQVHIRLARRERIATVVFGKGSDRLAVGHVTLGEFGLAVDPAGHRLVEARHFLMRAG